MPDEAPGAGTHVEVRAPGSARDRAATTTHDAWEEAVAVRRAAQQEAAAILQHAAEEALAIRRTAEQEAADLRSAAMRMSAELGQVAALGTEYLGKHARPEPWPPAWPTASAPVVQAALVQPGTGPRSVPAAKSATRPAAAMRKMVVAFATLIHVILAARVTEMGLARVPLLRLRRQR